LVGVLLNTKRGHCRKTYWLHICLVADAFAHVIAEQNTCSELVHAPKKKSFGYFRRNISILILVEEVGLAKKAV
jgi:hypothetical protein